MFHNYAGTGPFGGGQEISLALWLKTEQDNSEMILQFYGGTWGQKLKMVKDYILVSLDRGIPTVYGTHDRSMRASGISSLADGFWHHIAVVMPTSSCQFSELKIFVDGKEVSTEMTPSDMNNEHLFFLTPGKVSFGGLGYASSGTYDYFDNMIPFQGMLDDVTIWSRSLGTEDIRRLSKRMYGKRRYKKMDNHVGKKCVMPDPMFSQEVDFEKRSRNQCRLKCKKRKNCLGFQTRKDLFECIHFSVVPEVDSTAVDDMSFLCGQVYFQ